jgi:hypothetical protein
MLSLALALTTLLHADLPREPPPKPVATAPVAPVAAPVAEPKPATAAPAEPKPAGDMAAVLAGIPADPPPEHLSADVHFPTSNENQLHLWHAALKDRGGAFLGVGTDQVYQMAAWAKSDLIVAMDFDQVVVDLHWAYRAMFLAAKTPKEFLELWSAKKTKELDEILDKGIANEAQRKATKDAVSAYRRRIELRLHRERGDMELNKLKTFLDDQGQYDFIVQQITAGRWVAVRGDLTADKTVLGVGAALKQLGIPLRVYYPSNAERYWPYSQQYRDNMLSLPMDDKTIVLRTQGAASKTNVDPYHYVVQSGPNFTLWMKQPTPRVINMLVHKKATKVEHLYELDAVPTDADMVDHEAAKEAAKAAKAKAPKKPKVEKAPAIK